MRLRYFAVSLLSLAAATAGAQSAKPAQAGKSPEFRVDFTKETLPNGLTVIYHVDTARRQVVAHDIVDDRCTNGATQTYNGSFTLGLTQSAGRARRPSRGKRARKLSKSRTRFTSLMRRAIDTRMKMDDCWMAQILPRVLSRS